MNTRNPTRAQRDRENLTSSLLIERYNALIAATPERGTVVELGRLVLSLTELLGDVIVVLALHEQEPWTAAHSRAPQATE